MLVAQSSLETSEDSFDIKPVTQHPLSQLISWEPHNGNDVMLFILYNHWRCIIRCTFSPSVNNLCTTHSPCWLEITEWSPKHKYQVITWCTGKWLVMLNKSQQLQNFCSRNLFLLSTIKSLLLTIETVSNSLQSCDCCCIDDFFLVYAANS